MAHLSRTTSFTNGLRCRSLQVPSFEQCVMTLANKQIRRSCFNSPDFSQQGNAAISQRASCQRCCDFTRDALELEVQNMLSWIPRHSYSGTLKSLPREFRSSVLSQIKYIQPGSMLESYDIRAFVPRTSIQRLTWRT